MLTYIRVETRQDKRVSAHVNFCQCLCVWHPVLVEGATHGSCGSRPPERAEAAGVDADAVVSPEQCSVPVLCVKPSAAKQTWARETTSPVRKTPHSQ